jgi:glycosyltransferase involved in cell wall biosynthesis
MKKVLILCAHRPSRSPSQRYRFEQYLSFLEQEGFEFTFSNLLNEKYDEVFYAKGHFFSKALILLKSLFTRLEDSAAFRSFDIIFIQREAQFLGTSYFEKKAYESGAYVIFDFDDSIWLADTSPGNKKWEWVKKPEKFFKNIGYAHCVMAGNAYLLEKALEINKNSVLIPTTINTNLHIPKHNLRHKERICIGWSGSLSTIKHFELLLPVLLKLKTEFGNSLIFKVICNSPYVHPELEIDSVIWSEGSEVDELNGFDIGLMPLPNDAWAKGKCGLKGLSYMACEVPVVMSDVGVNHEIIQEGWNGFLAVTEADWLSALKKLIADKALRLQIGKNGRETVIQKYSVEKYKSEYLKIFWNAQSGR